MRKKSVWLILSCLMVVSLVLASCAPAVVEKEKEEEAPKVEAPKVEAPKIEAPKIEAPKIEAPGYSPPGQYSPATAPEMPQYGGTLRIAQRNEPSGFDVLLYQQAYSWHTQATDNRLIMSDWSRGPAGTGEFSLLYSQFGFNQSYAKGELAASWEAPDPDTIVYHIRQGVYWHDKPPYNGRMLTTEDVAKSIRALFTVEGANMRVQYPGFFKSVEVDPNDPWAVILRGDHSVAPVTEVLHQLGEYQALVPVEARELYGGLGDWRHAVGTGAFMLEDYVPETSLRLVRNPNYWQKDPVGPGKGNQLPYLDGMKAIIIVDYSTALAALRTAQIDRIPSSTRNHAILYNDAQSLRRTNPKLEWTAKSAVSPLNIGLRVDQPQLPTYNKDVRRALCLAVDNQVILDTYFNGAGWLVHGPLTPESEATWVPLEEMPESIREQYEYHPDKARELLAKAGYPNGFEINVLSPNFTDYVDQLSIVKEYWDDIGVTMNIDIRESGLYNSMVRAGSYKTGLVAYAIAAIPYTGPTFDPNKFQNVAYVNDPIGNELRAKVFEWMEKEDQAARSAAATKANLYFMEGAYYLVLPAPWQYAFWWPWVKNYYGVREIGYGNWLALTYIWIDQDLKKEMGY